MVITCHDFHVLRYDRNSLNRSRKKWLHVPKLILHSICQRLAFARLNSRMNEECLILSYHTWKSHYLFIYSFIFTDCEFFVVLLKGIFFFTLFNWNIRFSITLQENIVIFCIPSKCFTLSLILELLLCLKASF